MFAMLLYFVCAIFSFAIYKLIKRKQIKSPPGPWFFPFIGNIFQLGATKHTVLTSWSKKYGPIFQFGMGPDRCICLSNTNLIREANSQHAFLGKYCKGAKAFMSGGHKGLVFSQGRLWTEQRKFTVQHLRNFGYGRNSIEDLIMKEAKEFSDWLHKQNGTPIDFRRKILLAVANVVWRIMSGERFDHNDAKLHKIIRDIQACAAVTLEVNSLKSFIRLYLPSLAKMFPKWSGWGNMVTSYGRVQEIYASVIKQHQTVQVDQPRDFIDAYLNKMEQTKDTSSCFHPQNGTTYLIALLDSIFTAAMDATSVSLSWLFHYLTQNPRAQEKLHVEIQAVLGNRRPSLSDRKKMPYAEAVVQETLRLAPTVTIMEHLTTEDVNFRSYNIPKGTPVFYNFYAGDHDAAMWGENVNEFVPERFLDPSETFLIRNEDIIKFSAGKRDCPGQTLARDTIFLFMVQLVQNFMAKPIDDMTKPSSDYIKQFTFIPANSKLRMEPRPFCSLPDKM